MIYGAWLGLCLGLAEPWTLWDMVLLPIGRFCPSLGCGCLLVLRYVAGCSGVVVGPLSWWLSLSWTSSLSGEVPLVVWDFHLPPSPAACGSWWVLVWLPTLIIKRICDKDTHSFSLTHTLSTRRFMYPCIF